MSIANSVIRNNTKDFYENFHKNSKLSVKKLKTNNFTYKIIFSTIYDFLSNHKINNVLDYGCGVGNVSFFLAGKGYKVFGTDISSKAISLANRKSKYFNLNKWVHFYTLDKFSKLKKTKFDLILCFEVIEHIKDDKKFIKYLHSIIMSDGYLILSTPSKNAPLFKLGLLYDFDRKVGHLRRYKPLEIINKLEENGFTVERLIKTEGVLRNSLFTINGLGILIKFIKGPIVNIVSLIDNITLKIFGESDLIIIAKKNEVTLSH